MAGEGIVNLADPRCPFGAPLSPRGRQKVSSVPSSFHDQFVARSGTIELRLFCLTCWSNMTRLLKTPIIRSETIVPSSWIDILAGLSGSYIFRMPPDFCANATSAGSASNSDPATARMGRGRFMSSYLPMLVARSSSWRDPRPNPAIPGPFAELSFKVLTSWQFTIHKSKRQDSGRRAPFPATEGYQSHASFTRGPTSVAPPNIQGGSPDAGMPHVRSVRGAQ